MAFAKVIMPIGAEATIAAGIATQIGAPIKAPGLTQEQTAIYLAGLNLARDEVIAGGPTQTALFDKDGQFAGVVVGRDVKLPDGGSAAPIVGIAAPGSSTPAGDGLPKEWGAVLAKACDGIGIYLKNAEKSATVPTDFGNFSLVSHPITTIVIVGQIAAAAIAATAAWRYLDPDARIGVAAIQAATDAYKDRLREWRATGRLPPSSEVERGNLKTIEKWAEQAGKRGWLIGGAVLGGGVVGAGAGAALHRHFSR